MAIVYMMRKGDRLLICDKQLFNDKNNKEICIGFPSFWLEAKGQLTEQTDDILRMMGTMEEGKSYKMVLKKWPIE